MRLKLIKGCVVKGFPGLSRGDIFEPDSRLAGELLAMGLAEEAPMKREVVYASPPVIQAREPAVENRDPVAEPPKVGRRIRPSRPV